MKQAGACERDGGRLAGINLQAHPQDKLISIDPLTEHAVMSRRDEPAVISRP